MTHALLSVASCTTARRGDDPPLGTKQSEHSGKGYWFALLPLGGTGYTLEAGVYIGSETFRIAKASVTLLATSWARRSTHAFYTRERLCGPHRFATALALVSHM